jgi:hypothetical protein
VSFDKGENWNKWTTGYPTVSTYDLAIHPRENDLVIGTFGRSIWIIDNIAPLREMAKTAGTLLNEKVAVFLPSSAVMASTKNLPGYYYRGDAMYEGENRPVAAMITCYVSEVKSEKAKIEIINDEGAIVRNFDSEVKKGFNRILWRFERNVPVLPGQINRGGTQQEAQEERGRFMRMQGNNVIPGEYRVKISFDSGSSESKINVLNDPRMPQANIEVMKQNYRKADEIASRIKELNGFYQQFYDFSTSLNKVDELTKKNTALADAVKDFHGQFRDKYYSVDRKLTNRPDGLFARINGYRVLVTATDKLNVTEEKNVADALSALDESVKIVDDFIKQDIPGYRKNLADKSVSLEVLLK